MNYPSGMRASDWKHLDGRYPEGVEDLIGKIIPLSLAEPCGQCLGTGLKYLAGPDHFGNFDHDPCPACEGAEDEKGVIEEYEEWTDADEDGCYGGVNLLVKPLDGGRQVSIEQRSIEDYCKRKGVKTWELPS